MTRGMNMSVFGGRWDMAGRWWKRLPPYCTLCRMVHVLEIRVKQSMHMHRTSFFSSPADKRRVFTYCTVSCTTAKLVKWLHVQVNAPPASDSVEQPFVSQSFALEFQNAHLLSDGQR